MSEVGVVTTSRPSHLVGVATGLGIGGLAITTVGLLVWAGNDFAPLPTGILLVPVLPAVTYTAVGALLAARVPRNPVGWLFLVGGLAFTLILPVELLVARSYEALRPPPPLTSYLAWLVSSFATPILFGLLALAGLLFPDGRFQSRRWRWVGVVAVGGGLALGLSAALDPAGLVWYPTLGNPVRAPAFSVPILGFVRGVGIAALLASFVGVVAAQRQRYRSGDAVTRAQLRWVLSAAALQVLLLVPFIVVRYVVPEREAPMSVLIIGGQVALIVLPLAAAFAITRYHLFGIDILIGRSMVYVPLMGVLGGLYAFAVAVFQRVFVTLTGGTSDIALFMGVFLIAATFTPMRKALEGLVDRWARPTVPGAPAAADVVTTVEVDEDLQRTAASLISLRQLERRLSSGDRAPSDRSGRRLDIGDDGVVPCPHGLRSFTTCLGCPHLVAITTSPPAIDCDLPA